MTKSLASVSFPSSFWIQQRHAWVSLFFPHLDQNYVWILMLTIFFLAWFVMQAQKAQNFRVHCPTATGNWSPCYREGEKRAWCSCIQSFCGQEAHGWGQWLCSAEHWWSKWLQWGTSSWYLIFWSCLHLPSPDIFSHCVNLICIPY